MTSEISTPRRKVLVAMSGGVDSAVAAARVVAAGHEAVGVHMALARDPAQNRVGSRGCCTVEDAFDARRVADALGIPFYVWDLSTEFTAAVIDDFVTEYAAGRTPNPCVRCNERIKFAELLQRGLALGFDAIATGHYAQVSTEGGDLVLRRARDMAKDQSYVLAVMGPEALRRCIFPLGDVKHKEQVRAEAEALGFRVANKPDSHDICFIPDGDTRGWLAERLPGEPGNFVDSQGNVVGSHDGARGFTVGQRRGLHLSIAPVDGKPRYVLDVSVAKNEVTVGGAAELRVRQVIADNPVWLMAPPDPTEVLLAQARAHGTPFPVRIDTVGDQLHITPEGELTAIAAGQTIVIYRADTVIVSATVAACTR